MAQYNALIICSFGADDNYVLTGENTTYPDIVENYRYTYARARAMVVDIFLGSHPFFFNMQEVNFQRMLSEQQGR